MAWLDALQPLLRVPEDRFAQLATVDPEGHPRNRTIVVRELDPEGLFFTADRHSAKVTQIEAESRAELCWYLRDARLQFRLSGRLEAAPYAHHRIWSSLSDATRTQFVAESDCIVYLLRVTYSESLDVSQLPLRLTVY